MLRARFVAAITLLAGGLAHAHVQPSVDDNNRYIKLTPLGDRVRIAYTILYGEIPGARERARIDTDHDGVISEAEAGAFANRIAGEVAAALQLDIDGAARKVAWDETTMSVGTPQVAAGTFAVDLVMYACLPGARGRHRVGLRDNFRVPSPGEVEVLIEDVPGVTIERAHVGAVDDPTHDLWLPPPGAGLADDGLELVFVAGDRAPIAGGCAAAAPAGGTRVWPYVVAAAGAAVAVALALALRRRAKRNMMRGSAAS